MTTPMPVSLVDENLTIEILDRKLRVVATGTVIGPQYVEIGDPVPTVVEILVPGPQGPRGPLGPHEIFIQPDEPRGVEQTYLWVQTGLGPDGRGWTLWFKDDDL